MTFLCWLWCRHIQKTLASIIGAFAVIDLSPYADDFHDLIPWRHWHAVLRLTGAIAIFWRATQAGKGN